MNRILAIAFGFCLAGALAAPVVAEDRPPADARPLAEVVALLENGQIDVITEIDWDSDKWEIEARKDDKWFDLDISPSGEILKRESTGPEKDVPPADSLPLSHILNGIERAHAPARITEVEFDDDHWEIQLRDGDRKIDLKINPRSGHPKGG